VAYDDFVWHNKRLYNRPGDAPPLKKNSPLPWGSRSPLSTWFLCPTQVHIRNGRSIGSSISVGRMVVTNRHRGTQRQKEHRTRYICSKRPHTAPVLRCSRTFIIIATAFQSLPLDVALSVPFLHHTPLGGSVAEWIACWTQAQRGPGSNRSRDAVG